MKVKKSKLEILSVLIIYLILVILCCLTLYPMIHVAALAFSSQAEAVRPGLHLYPREVDFSSFLKVLQSKDILVSYFNTLHRTIIGTGLSVLVTGMAAYALSKKYLPFGKFYMYAIMFTMWFSGGLIPSFLINRSLGLYDNRWAMILPVLVFGYYLIIMKAFFQSIPESLEESARIDGASELRIFFQLIVPLSTPVIATVSLWLMVFHWNAYFDNMIYIVDKSKWVLQRMIRDLLVVSNLYYMDATLDETTVVPESLKASTILVSTIPILIVYPFAQKYFIKGVMIGAIKG